MLLMHFISLLLELKKMFIQIKQELYGLKQKKLGKYDIACAEYCGLNHSYMYNKVNVISEKDFNTWLSKNSINDSH